MELYSFGVVVVWLRIDLRSLEALAEELWLSSLRPGTWQSIWFTFLPQCLVCLFAIWVAGSGPNFSFLHNRVKERRPHRENCLPVPFLPAF